jgi:sortase A
MQRRVTSLVVLGVLVISGCAKGDPSVEVGDAAGAFDDVPTLIAPSTAAPTTAPRTTGPRTTVPPTTVPPTTLAPTTTLPPLPTPEPPPLDKGIPGAQVGSITIPKIGLALPLFDGINTATLDEGPGHWPGTARPGELGNAVIAAHRVSHGAPFRSIDQLVVGDQVQFTLPQGTSTYEVTATDVVTPEAIDIITQSHEHTATLFACHPPGSTKFRYVVKLRLVGP